MNNSITSKNNPLVKQINRLRKKKNRDKEELFIIESEKLVLEALKSDISIINLIFRDDYENVDSFYKEKNKVYLDSRLFNSISSLVSPDGVMAIAKVKKSSKILTSRKILILENLQDPGNLGSLVRSAEAFGFNDLLLINSVDIYNEKVLRATMGSAFRLNINTIDYSYMERLKEAGYYLLSADMCGEDYRDINYKDKIALIIGNEGQDISKKMQSMVDISVKIPMDGEIESLNAAISGSILMSAIKLNK